MAHEQQQPMSDARLQKIWAFFELLTHTIRQGGERADFARDFHDIKAEVERLRAREAALVAQNEQAMAVVREVAEECTVAMWPAINGGNYDTKAPWCAACLCIQLGDDSIHTDCCPVMQASALLASTAEADASAASSAE